MVRGLIDVTINSPIIVFMSVPLRLCKKALYFLYHHSVIARFNGFLAPGLCLGRGKLSATRAEVFLIFAILAALAIPTFLSISDQTKQKHVLGDL